MTVLTTFRSFLIVSNNPIHVHVHVIKLFSQSYFFTYKSISTCEYGKTLYLYFDFVFLSISKLQYRNTYSYVILLLLLSGDINLNSNLLHNDQLQPEIEWSVFNSRGLYFIYLNVNNL